jgi:thioredoxin-dependent peroxiredoxin
MPAVVAAQRSAAPPVDTTPPLEIGAVAPDFTMKGATRYGVLASPVHLSDFKGKTVVLAFFFKARTSGWTVQMNAYRDQYAQLFKNGRNVVLIAISADPDTALASWARDSEFPFLFASDTGTAVGKRYGALASRAGMTNRNLFVVGPDGRIAYRATPFREIDPTAYTELGAAIDKSVRWGVAASDMLLVPV